MYALQLAQKHPVRLAHHLHAPAQLIEAARRRVPALALIRQPRDAVLSHLVREPWIDMRDAAAGYARFYRCLMPYRSAFVVGEFEEVTHDFASVVRRLNVHFGLRLEEFEPSEANMNLCFESSSGNDRQLSKVLLGFESGTVTFDELQAERRRAEPAASSPGSGDETNSSGSLHRTVRAQGIPARPVAGAPHGGAAAQGRGGTAELRQRTDSRLTDVMQPRTAGGVRRCKRRFHRQRVSVTVTPVDVLTLPAAPPWPPQ